MLPEIFSIPTYYIYLSLLFSAFIWVVPFFAEKEKKDSDILMKLMLILMIVGLVGSRATHVFYEDWGFYKNNPAEIFYLWRGGFVFLGGAIPAVIACIYFLKWKKEDISSWMDFWAPFGALGYGLGRISCLLTGCCFGKICELPWAIQGRHPTQLYSVIWEIITFLLLLNLKSFLKKKDYLKGNLFWIWIFFHSLGRLIMENYRDDFRGHLMWSYTLSEVLSYALLVTAILMLVRNLSQASS